MQVTALLRDGRGSAALGVPLTLVVERPDGVEYRRSVVTDQGLGGRSLAIALVPSAPTGTWRVRAFADPKRPPVGEATFMVEDYVPDRLEFDLAADARSISRSSRAEITVEGRYLYGAPAGRLGLEGELVIKPASERAGFAGYQFGLADEDVEMVRAPLEGLPETDAAGKARFPVTLDRQPASTRPLEAQVVVRMAEPGGRAIERKLTLPVVAAGPMIGVRPLFSGRSLGEGEHASFDVIVVAPDGNQMARRGLRYELLKVETRYQWYRRDGVWDFEPVKTTRRVADGDIDVAAGAPARISIPVQWGRYRLEVATADRDGPVTSIGFDAGWYAQASADTPDLLEVALDKPEYAAGEAMTVAVTARTAGRVTINVIGDRMVATVAQDVTAGTARIRVPVGSDWGSGAYVVATLRRPLDSQAVRMPGRAIGVQWFSINRKARTLALDLELPPLTRPNSALRIPVRVWGLAAGEEARIVVAAVDVGILNLTAYKPPAPDDHYLGQRRLTADIRDLYGQLIDGMQGTRGQIKVGGDAPAELQGSPPSQKPLALYSGIVAVNADGTAEVVFDIPDFSGTARVMAVAWSKDKVGRAVGDAVIRDPVVLTATLPRFLNNGDRGTMHLEIDNVEGGAGDYRLEVKGEGIAGATAPQTLRLDAGQRRSVAVPLAASAAGTASVSVRLSGPGELPARAQLCAPGETGDADHRATHGQAARQGRKPRAVERHARRSGAGDRSRRAVGRPFVRARRRRAPGGARPLPVRVLGADREPRPAAALRQRARQRRAARTRRHGRPAHSRRHRPAARAPGLQRLVRAVDGGRRGRVARRLRHRFPDAGARARLPRARSGLQARARSPAQLRRQCRGRRQGRRRQLRLCALCAGAQRGGAGRRPALLRRRQARRHRHADGEGPDRRRARHARRRRARRARLCRGAGRDRAAACARPRPYRLRLGAARRGRAGDARLGGRRRAPHHHRCAGARGGGAQPDAPHLDPGERVDGAGGARARQGGADRAARGRRRAHAGSAQAQPARRRTAPAAQGDQCRRMPPCRRW